MQQRTNRLLAIGVITLALSNVYNSIMIALLRNDLDKFKKIVAAYTKTDIEVDDAFYNLGINLLARLEELEK